MTNGFPAALPMRIKLFHGIGAIAFGVKDNGFSVFLLIFYNQVLGMPAATVSLALALALLIDAIIDPVLGNLGDRTYTRWGRRLPWLYGAAIPLAIAWAVLWSPPIDGTPSFMSLLVIAVAVRMLLSACEVPSVALVPELTRDYDERTTLFRYRYLFGWTGGLGMMFLAYTVFLPGEAMLQRQGYVWYGVFGALVIAVSVIVSALGQHSAVAHLPEQRPAPFTVSRAFAEIREAFSERAFLILAAGALAAYVSQGMTFAITNYLYLFVWGFDTIAFAIYPIVLFFSVVIVFLTAGWLHRRYGKARTAAVATILAMVLWTLPYVLRLAGLWFETGTVQSTALLFVFILFSNSLAVTVMVSASSMVAEIVEAFQQRSGRRAEGSFYAGNWFVQKCATGLGIFVAGIIIDAAGMPANAKPGLVPEGVIDVMTALYVAAAAILAAISAYWLNRFPISRTDHEARVAVLANAAPPRQ